MEGGEAVVGGLEEGAGMLGRGVVVDDIVAFGCGFEVTDQRVGDGEWMILPRL